MSWARIPLIVLAALFLWGPPAAGQTATAGTPRTASVTGIRTDGDVATISFIRVVVPEGIDQEVVIAEALRSVGAKPADPAELAQLGFDITGGRWMQFFNRGRRDDRVVQSYNPAGAPIADDIESSVLAAQATWSGVRSSRFRFEYGGLTAREQQTGDGFYDIGWREEFPRAVGITFFTVDLAAGAAIDADVFLNPNLPWTTHPPPPLPPHCFPPPPRGTPPAPDCVPPPLVFDVQTVLLHEVGHALGLDHVFDPEAVMFPDYRGVQRVLSDGDIAGITFLYPKKPVAPLTHHNPSTPIRLIATADHIIPSGTAFWTAFEPGGLNSRGDVSFTADVGERCSDTVCWPAYGQGVFVTQHRWFTQVVRTPQDAPDNSPGTVLGAGVWGASALNDSGDMAFAFSHELGFSLPIGLNAGVYRYNASRGDVEAVLVPFVTPATSCRVIDPGNPCTFAGGQKADINARGDIAFAGVLSPRSEDLSEGIFVAHRTGAITHVAVPGDTAPGGSLFDFLASPSLNDFGDVAFDAHRTIEACNALGIGGCLTSAYVWRAAEQRVEPIARQGDAAPGGGSFRFAVQPVINNRGDILFTADLTPPDRPFGRDLGLFLFSRGSIAPIVRPGDEMPGGGRLLTTSLHFTTGPVYSLADNGTVAFDATLDTDVDEDGIFDTGVYVWADGRLRLVARTGTQLPRIGDVQLIQDRRVVGARRSLAGALVNNRGQVLFQAILTDFRSVLLIADPPATQK